MNLLLELLLELLQELLLVLLLLLKFCCYCMYFIMWILESLRAMHEIRWNFKRGPSAGNTCMERLNKLFCRTLHDRATWKKYQHDTS